MKPAEKENENIIRLSDNNKKSQILPDLAISIKDAKKRMELLRQFVNELMIEGIDYGIIEGYQKPSLLKPGAEKLCDIFGFSKHVNIINRIENWEKGFFAYEVKVTLVNKQSGFLEAEGVGTCNSKERAYLKNDPYSLLNTLLKMAEKRALIDAVLSATRASGIFTQDLEDLPVKGGEEPVTERQLQMIFRTIADINMRPETAKEMMQMMYQVDHSTKLTKKQASSFIQDLMILKTNH